MKVTINYDDAVTIHYMCNVFLERTNNLINSNSLSPASKIDLNYKIKIYKLAFDQLTQQIELNHPD